MILQTKKIPWNLFLCKLAPPDRWEDKTSELLSFEYFHFLKRWRLKLKSKLLRNSINSWSRHSKIRLILINCNLYTYYFFKKDCFVLQGGEKWKRKYYSSPVWLNVYCRSVCYSQVRFWFKWLKPRSTN